MCNAWMCVQSADSTYVRQAYKNVVVKTWLEKVTHENLLPVETCKLVSGPFNSGRAMQIKQPCASQLLQKNARFAG
jgi:hypothetical protein